MLVFGHWWHGTHKLDEDCQDRALKSLNQYHSMQGPVAGTSLPTAVSLRSSGLRIPSVSLLTWLAPRGQHFGLIQRNAAG